MCMMCGYWQGVIITFSCALIWKELYISHVEQTLEYNYISVFPVLKPTKYEGFQRTLQSAFLLVLPAYAHKHGKALILE